MKQKTITVGCALTADEYKRLQSICEQQNTYPSAAIREAVVEWMEKHGK